MVTKDVLEAVFAEIKMHIVEEERAKVAAFLSGERLEFARVTLAAYT